jgi:hypothetical protein
MSGFAESRHRSAFYENPPLVIAAAGVVNGLIECVMLPELLAQQFSGKYIGDACTPILVVIRRNRGLRPSGQLVADLPVIRVISMGRSLRQLEDRQDE